MISKLSHLEQKAGNSPADLTCSTESKLQEKKKKLWGYIAQESPQTKDGFLKAFPDSQETEMTINSRAVCFHQRKYHPALKTPGVCPSTYLERATNKDRRRRKIPFQYFNKTAYEEKPWETTAQQSCEMGKSPFSIFIASVWNMLIHLLGGSSSTPK